MNFAFIVASLATVLLALATSDTEAVRIDVDTSKAPDLANFGSRVKKTLEDWYTRIRDRLMSPTFKDIDSIPIYFDPDYNGIAYASGGRIVGAVKYYREHMEGVGSMIHEMTHVIQGYKNGPGWFTEGCADYIRYYIYEPNNKPGKPGRNNKYTDGYGVTAYFLNYIVERVRRDMVSQVNRASREGTYKDSIWKDLTGKTLDQMWSDMMKSG